MKLTRRGQVVVYPTMILAMLSVMGLAGWVEGGF
jgi:hypothetical protein